MLYVNTRAVAEGYGRGRKCKRRGSGDLFSVNVRAVTSLSTQTGANTFPQSTTTLIQTTAPPFASEFRNI